MSNPEPVRNIEEVFNKFDSEAKPRVISNMKQTVRRGVVNNPKPLRLSYEHTSSLQSIQKKDSGVNFVQNLVNSNGDSYTQL